VARPPSRPPAPKKPAPPKRRRSEPPWRRREEESKKPRRGGGGPPREDGERGPQSKNAVGYRLDIEYQGTQYSGWQIQQNARTVAGVLEAALRDAGCDVVELQGAGRTDAGVHALHQVAHLRLRRGIEPEPLRRELNDRLPGDVHVLRIGAVPRGFHARHDAVERSYLYQISRRRTAFGRRFVWWVRDRIEVERLRSAATVLEGRHDFRRFCVAAAEQTSTLVQVEGVEIVEAGDLILLRLRASHFLWRMVRRTVGTLVEAGTGRLPVEEMAALLDPGAPDRDPGPAQWTAPPSGLFLERVRYEGDPPMGEIRPVVEVAAFRGR
jgi:tRNA pseudouridine38-40 synthase